QAGAQAPPPEHGLQPQVEGRQPAGLAARHRLRGDARVEIAGRTLLVTGGGSGLGAATARMVVEAGGSVVVADVDADRGKQVADGLGERARFVPADVTDEDSVRAAVAAAAEGEGGLGAGGSCGGMP